MSEPIAPDATLTALADAAAGLLVPSESDYPLELFRWARAEPLTPATLLAALDLPPDTLVETMSVDAFFAPLVREADWMDGEQRAAARRFVALRDRIAAALADPVIYRVGRIEIRALIVGRSSDGAVGGLTTTLIET
jgi:hypothetical protein